MKQTIIGISVSLDQKDRIRKGIEYAYIRREYGLAVKAAGGVPVFLDPSTDPSTAAELCDGIVISGGDDIHPSLYGEAVRVEAGFEPIERTRWELALLAACERQQKPVLGVCYGLQLLNVYFGGTLYQDIAQEYGSTLDHGSSEAQATHAVTFTEDFLGYSSGQSVPSAARHHQAVKDVADGLRVSARAEDGIIEALQGKGCFGVQWHAESDATAVSIYGVFIRHCGATKTRRVGSLSTEPV